MVSVMLSVAARAPAAAGAKETLAVQAAPLASEPAQEVAVCTKSPGFAPPNAKPVSEILVGRTFLIVMTLAALVVPTFCFENGRDAGVTDTGRTPVPERATVCGLLFALSAIVSVAVCAPLTVGAKMTPILHDECAATLDPHVLEETSNCAAAGPVIDVPTDNADDSLFVRVTTFCALELPSASFPNASVELDSATC